MSKEIETWVSREAYYVMQGPESLPKSRQGLFEVPFTKIDIVHGTWNHNVGNF